MPPLGRNALRTKMRSILQGTHLGEELNSKSNTRGILIHNILDHGVDRIATPSSRWRAENGADRRIINVSCARGRRTGEFDVTWALSFTPEFLTDNMKAIRQDGQGRPRVCFGCRGGVRTTGGAGAQG